MTREEAKKMFRDDKNSQGCYKAVLTKIDKIYDAFEEQIKQGQLLPIDSVSGMFSSEELEQAYKDGVKDALAKGYGTFYEENYR